MSNADPDLSLSVRPRRLRMQADLRAMLPRTVLRRSDFIAPIFVTEGSGVRQEVASMPGVFQMSIDVALPWLALRAAEGFKAYLIFGLIERSKKDAIGSAALDEDNLVCRLLQQAVTHAKAGAAVVAPSGPEEAIREARLDIEQGADLVMVKPAGAYLDIIAAVRRKVRVPVVAY